MERTKREFNYENERGIIYRNIPLEARAGWKQQVILKKDDISDFEFHSDTAGNGRIEVSGVSICQGTHSELGYSDFIQRRVIME